MPTTVISFRVEIEIKRKLENLAQKTGVNIASILRQAVLRYIEHLETSDEEVQRLKYKARLVQIIEELRLLTGVQKAMIASGSYLLKDAPKDVPRAKRWIATIDNPEEREALERILYQRDKLSRELARIVNKLYPEGRLAFTFIDRPPYIEFRRIEEITKRLKDE